MRGLQLGKGACGLPLAFATETKKRDTLRGIGYGETVTMKRKENPNASST